MNELQILQDETIEEFLWRLGCLKECGSIHLTWPEQATILNEANGNEEDFTESHWRKKYRKMQLEKAVKEKKVSLNQTPNLVSFFTEIEKQRIRAKEDRASYTRALREQARKDAILDIFSETISSFDPIEIQSKPETPAKRSIYAMQSDIHYGLTFDSYSGKYNSDIAKERIMAYAERIIQIGKLHNAEVCYVSLMGDLISGIIHTTIRIENRENLIEQIVGVSEQISSFLYKLASVFNTVIVNNVDGNHSRVDLSADDALRAEKLDALIPWYCKTKLQNVKNISFQDNKLDSSIGSFFIYDKSYVSVHGDMDGDLKASGQKIEQMTNDKIDYLLAGHMHVADMRIENTGYIRNGSVCGSGDEYTVKKRLFGPPVQVCMIVSPSGVEAIYPVNLRGV